MEFSVQLTWQKEATSERTQFPHITEVTCLHCVDMKRLRVHRSSTMDGRIFLQFIALIYISAIRKKIKGNKAIEHFTVRGLIEEMETLCKITYSGRYKSIMTESTKMHKTISNIFGIDITS